MVLALLGITYTHSRMNAEVVVMMESNQKRIERLDQMWMLLVDAEASAFAFLLMRSDLYLEPYRNSASRLKPLMAAMNFDTPAGSDDHEDWLILKRLVEAKLQHLGETLSRGRAPLAMSEDRGEMGKQLMDEIRVRLQILKLRREKADQHLASEYMHRVNKIQYAGYALGFASLCLILGLFVVQHRQVALRAKIQGLLETENSRLEAKVWSRTRELSNLASHLTNAREEERQRIARELHDEMGASLTAAKMDASWLRRHMGPHISDDMQERLLRLIESIGNTITLTRRLVDDLQPPLLKGLGLTEALRVLCEQHALDWQVDIDFPDKDLRFTQPQSLALYRIAQEAMNNIRKYARASHVKVSLTQQNDVVVLQVQDNGIGFDSDNLDIHGHGIAGMKHRTQMFSGRLAVFSKPGQGTRIEVQMPVIAPQDIS